MWEVGKMTGTWDGQDDSFNIVILGLHLFKLCDFGIAPYHILITVIMACIF